MLDEEKIKDDHKAFGKSWKLILKYDNLTKKDVFYLKKLT